MTLSRHFAAQMLAAIARGDRETYYTLADQIEEHDRLEMIDLLATVGGRWILLASGDRLEEAIASLLESCALADQGLLSGDSNFTLPEIPDNLEGL